MKVSPCNGVIRFQKKGKLGLRYIEPYRVIARMGKVAYRLMLLEDISSIHKNSHDSQLRNCLVGDETVVPLDDIKVNEELNYMEKPIVV